MDFPTDSASFADDKSKCDQKLGEEPSPPPENKIIISESVVERIQSGTVDEERIASYDNYWMDRLACIDETHTQRNGLDMKSAEKMLTELSTYARPTAEKSCPGERKRLIDCHQLNKDHALNCNREVENFVSCVDRLLAEATRPDSATAIASSNNKKLTYAERFERES